MAKAREHLNSFTNRSNIYFVIDLILCQPAEEGKQTETEFPDQIEILKHISIRNLYF